MHLAEITKETLEPHIGSEFTVTFNDGKQVQLQLVKVVRIMERITSPNLKREPFAAYFEAPDSIYIQQGIHAFSHETLGDLSIFIVPVTRENSNYRYEAIFT